MNDLYVSKDGQQHGPFSLEQVCEQVQSGCFSPADFAWCEGMPDWTPIGEFLPRKTQTPQKVGTPTQSAPRAAVSSSRKTLSKKRRAQKLPVKNTKQKKEEKDPIGERIWNVVANILGGLCWLMTKTPYVVILTLIVLAVVGIMTSHPPTDEEKAEQKQQRKREREKQFERDLYQAAKEYDDNH